MKTPMTKLVAAALCAVGLSSFAAEPEAVQLWEGGPYFATCNIGATKPEDYGILTNFNDAAQAVTDALGNGWRLPTKAEFEALLANCGKGTWTEQNGAKGRLFTGTGDYSSNSIFLPAAGYDEGAGRKWAEYYGRYWSSEEYGVDAWHLIFYDCDARLSPYNRSWGFSVRAVRDTPLVTGPTVKPYPADNSTAKVYTNGVEVTINPIVVLSNATVEVVFTTEEGYCFEDDHSTARTNTVEATDDPTVVNGPTVVKIPSMSKEVAQQAGYEVKEAEVETTISVTVVADPSVTLKSNGQEISEEDYANACIYYGIGKKDRPDVPSMPTAEDFKAVSKDAQVIGSDEIAVKKESIQAAKAETVQIVNGQIELGVSVMSNSNITAEIAEWGKVNLASENVKVENGNVVISIPVDSASGFMILQSKDAKVNNVPNTIIEDR